MNVNAGNGRRGDPVDLLHVAYGGLGGHLTVVNRLNAALNDRGHSTAVLGVTASPDEQLSPDHWMRTQYVPIVRARLRRNRGGVSELKDLMGELRPRVVIAHSHGLMPTFWLASQQAKVRPAAVLVEHHSLALRTWRDNLKSFLALSTASGIVFLSDEYRVGYPLAKALRLFNIRQWVIPNAVSLPAAPNARCGNEVAFTIGMSSRLVESKRLDIILESCVLLKSQGIDVILRVAGTGPMQDTWESRAAALGIADRVEFMGFLDEQQLQDFYSSLDAYVHITDGEGQSLSILEAAANSLPIVASRVTGVANQLESGRTGLLVANDPVALATTLTNLWLDQPLRQRLGAQARAWASQNHGLESSVNGYLAIFAELDPDGPWIEARSR